LSAKESEERFMATVTKDMSISDVLKLDRGAASVLISHGMHCLGCPHATAESLADACAAHGSDPDALVEKLNDYLSQKR
jgi:hybrid cluster-associated redox disulfide protein